MPKAVKACRKAGVIISAGNSARYCRTVVALLCMGTATLIKAASRRNRRKRFGEDRSNNLATSYSLTKS